MVLLEALGSAAGYVLGYGPSTVISGSVLANNRRSLGDTYWSNVHDSQSTTISLGSIPPHEFLYLQINLSLMTQKKAAHVHFITLTDRFLEILGDRACPLRSIFYGEHNQIIRRSVNLPINPFFIRSKNLNGSNKWIWIQVTPVFNANNQPVSFEFWTYQSYAGLVGGTLDRNEARQVLQDTLDEIQSFHGLDELVREQQQPK